MQDDINMYVTRDRLHSATFRQKLDPIAKNIFRRQNPLELTFKDISTFNAQNPIIGGLLREIDVGKKDLDSELLKKPSNVTDVLLKFRLDALRRDNDNNNNNSNINNSNNIFPPPPPRSTFFPPSPSPPLPPRNFLP